jgi:hypothetical protein
MREGGIAMGSEDGGGALEMRKVSQQQITHLCFKPKICGNLF